MTRRRVKKIARRCNLDFEFMLGYCRDVMRLRRQFKLRVATACTSIPTAPTEAANPKEAQ